MLQPNFISVWQFQAWNLSYNVSVEFDNYKHRYHWVKKGIDFLMDGIRYNRNEPRLLWDLGWFFGHKMGRSDEYRQFRREYRLDRDFHETLPIDVDAAKDFEGNPDNWLTAYQWFLQAQSVVDKEGVPIKGKNPLVFHSDIPKSLIRYGAAIEEGEDAVFGEIAANAWRRAHESWLEYGGRSIPTSYGYTIQLNEGERWDERVIERKQELEAFLPGLEERLKQDKLARLTDEERAVVGRNVADLTSEEYEIKTHADEKIIVTPDELVAAAPEGKRREARRLSNRVLEAEAYSTTIRRYRSIVNFIYWRTRCEVEKTDRAIRGREYMKEANDLVNDADLEGAREKYDEAWARWAKIHDENPVLADDVTAEDLVDQLKKYRILLNQLDEVFPPENFPMLRLVANYRDEFGLSEEEANAMLEEADRMDELPKSDAAPAVNAADNEPPSDVTTEETPVDETSVDEAPADEAPADETPADETPADETPADEIPADEIPADEIPADEIPADEIPADEIPADEIPADQIPA
jgi:hypothetical protein